MYKHKKITVMKVKIIKFLDLILKLSEKTENLIVISWTLPNLERGYYLQDQLVPYFLT